MIEYVYPPDALTLPTPTPQPWAGMTVEQALTEYIPALQGAIKECNADKRAIFNLKVKGE